MDRPNQDLKFFVGTTYDYYLHNIVTSNSNLRPMGTKSRQHTFDNSLSLSQGYMSTASNSRGCTNSIQERTKIGCHGGREQEGHHGEKAKCAISVIVVQNVDGGGGGHKGSRLLAFLHSLMTCMTGEHVLPWILLAPLLEESYTNHFIQL